MGDLENNVTQNGLDYPSSNIGTEGFIVSDTFSGIELEIVYFSACSALVTLLNMVIDPIIFDTVMDGVSIFFGRPIFGAHVELVMCATTFLSKPEIE